MMTYFYFFFSMATFIPQLCARSSASAWAATCLRFWSCCRACCPFPSTFWSLLNPPSLRFLSSSPFLHSFFPTPSLSYIFFSFLLFLSFFSFSISLSLFFNPLLFFFLHAGSPTRPLSLPVQPRHSSYSLTLTHTLSFLPAFNVLLPLRLTSTSSILLQLYLHVVSSNILMICYSSSSL